MYIFKIYNILLPNILGITYKDDFIILEDI